MSKPSAGKRHKRAQQKRQRRNARSTRATRQASRAAERQASALDVRGAMLRELFRRPMPCEPPCSGTMRFVDGSERDPNGEQLAVMPFASVAFDRRCDACGRISSSVQSAPEAGGLGSGIDFEDLEEVDESRYATFADFFPPGQAPPETPRPPGPLYCDTCDTQVVRGLDEPPALDGTDRFCPTCGLFVTEVMPAQCDATRMVDGELEQCYFDVGHEGPHDEWGPPRSDCRAVVHDERGFPIKCSGNKGHAGNHAAQGQYRSDKKLVTYKLEWIGERPNEATIIHQSDGREAHN